MLSAKDLARMRATQEEALPDLLDVSRPSGTTSSIGSRVSGVDNFVEVSVPCRVTPAQQYVTLGERAQPLDIDRYTVRVPRGTNIQKRDQLRIQSSGLVLEVEAVKQPRSWETVMTITADVAE